MSNASSSPAFAPALGIIGRSCFAHTSAAVVSRRPSVPVVGPVRRTPPVKALFDEVRPKGVVVPQRSPLGKKYNTIEENRLAKIESEYRGPQGFTPYAEMVNSRMASLGFTIGLITEIFSKDHVTMADQILIMFSPLTHLAGTVLVGAAHAASSIPPVF